MSASGRSRTFTGLGLKQLPLLVGLRLRGRYGWNRTTRVWLMRPASSKERSVLLRRYELHVRPSAHEADELLLLHSAIVISSCPHVMRGAAATSRVDSPGFTPAGRAGACRPARQHDLQRMKLTSYYCSTPRRPRRDSLSNWTQSSESHGAREASSAKRSEPARRK
jgi:hypothetical protein